MGACIVGINFFMEVVKLLLRMAVVVLKSVVEDVELLLMIVYEVMVEVVVVALSKIDVAQFVETRAKEWTFLDINFVYRC